MRHRNGEQTTGVLDTTVCQVTGNGEREKKKKEMKRKVDSRIYLGLSSLSDLD